MNYGFDPTLNDNELERQIRQYIENLPFTDKYGMRCYVERDGLYPGIRVRRITHYTEDQRNEIVDTMERIIAVVNPIKK